MSSSFVLHRLAGELSTKAGRLVPHPLGTSLKLVSGSRRKGHPDRIASLRSLDCLAASPRAPAVPRSCPRQRLMWLES